MNNDKIGMAILAVFVIGCLWGISRIRNPTLTEKGHLVLSALPWGYVLVLCTIMGFVRMTTGMWPCRHIEQGANLPEMGHFGMGMVLGLTLAVILSPIIWLGWLVIRWRKGLRRYWVSSTIIFIAGLLAALLLNHVDPGNFWDWVWD